MRIFLIISLLVCFSYLAVADTNSSCTSYCSGYAPNCTSYCLNTSSPVCTVFCSESTKINLNNCMSFCETAGGNAPICTAYCATCNDNSCVVIGNGTISMSGCMNLTCKSGGSAPLCSINCYSFTQTSAATSNKFSSVISLFALLSVVVAFAAL